MRRHAFPLSQTRSDAPMNGIHIYPLHHLGFSKWGGGCLNSFSATGWASHVQIKIKGVSFQIIHYLSRPLIAVFVDSLHFP